MVFRIELEKQVNKQLERGRKGGFLRRTWDEAEARLCRNDRPTRCGGSKSTPYGIGCFKRQRADIPLISQLRCQLPPKGEAS